MGSGDWFKTIISRKRSKQDQIKKSKGSASERSITLETLETRSHSKKVLPSASCNGNLEHVCLSLEEVAARRIQTAYRGFRARKILHRLKGLQRLKILGQGDHIKKQTATTLSYLQSWNKIQAEIRTRRICMVTEGRIKQRKQENQLKLEAKLHEIEEVWCGGSETMEDILARMQQKEEAAVKRERAKAYAFSHQWRASSGGQAQFSYDFGKGNGGWSWVERWVAARPWESRLSIQPMTSLEKAPVKPATNKANTKTNMHALRVVSVRPKSAVTIGKSSVKRTLSKSLDEKQIVISSHHKANVTAV